MRWKRPAASPIGCFTARRSPPARRSPSAFRRGWDLLPAAEAERAIRHLAEVGLPTAAERHSGRAALVDRLMDLIAQDKKVKRGMLTFILVRGIGAAFVETGVDHRTCARFSARSSPGNDYLRLVDRRGGCDLPPGIGVLFRQRDCADRVLARRHDAAGEARQPRRDHRQPIAGNPRAFARSGIARQQRDQYRGVDLGDRPVACALRPRRRDLRHHRDDGAHLRALRSAAEDRRLQRARSHGACCRAADRADGFDCSCRS